MHTHIRVETLLYYKDNLVGGEFLLLRILLEGKSSKIDEGEENKGVEDLPMDSSVEKCLFSKKRYHFSK
jgi:hypothetical protein